MAHYPKAQWRGPIPNQSGGLIHPMRGLVIHIMEGSLVGTDGFFHNSNAKASAHFGIGKTGTVYQWVDTNDKAWAQAAGNPYWYSVENEGHTPDKLTDAQLQANAELFVWLSQQEGFPLKLANSPTDTGLGHHAMGGQAWGGHPCPGPNIIAQKPEILSRALAITHPPTPIEVKPMYDPPLQLEPVVASLKCPTGGEWLLSSSGSVYAFDCPFLGGANGKPYFAGRKAARLEAPNAVEAAAGKQYVILSTNNERYSYPE